MNRLLSLAALSLLSIGQAATGEVLDGTPQTIVQVLKQAGYLATRNDAGTTPSIQVTVDGDDAQFYLSGCAANVCALLRASTGFDVDADPEDVRDLVSSWNQDHDTQAYVDDDGTVYLDWAYVLTGGYTRANLLAWVKGYLNDLSTFEDDVVNDSPYYVLNDWGHHVP